jgi:hypothetical protein
MKAPSELSTDEMRAIISDIQMLLWLEMTPEGDRWNPDKEWDSETLEYVGAVLEERGLRPEKPGMGSADAVFGISAE